MNSPIPEPARRKSIIEYVSRLVDWLRPLEHISVSGGSLVISDKAMAFCLGGGSGSATSSAHPFKVSSRSSEDSFAVVMRAGSINNEVLEIVEPSPVEGSSVVYGHVVLDPDDGSMAVPPAVEIAESLPEDTPTDGHILFARLAVTEDAMTITQLVTHSLWHMYCGDKHIWGAV